MPWRRVNSKTSSWMLLIAIIASPACSVDDRQLSSNRSPADIGTAGASCSKGTGQLCDYSGGDDAGTADASSGNVATCSSGIICPDLNDDNQPDQTETLASTPTFDQDIGADGSWNPEFGIGLGWNDTDACGRCDSGSISVTNQFAGTSSYGAVGGAMQCIVATPNELYTIMAMANPAAGSLGGVGLAFYETTDCSGDRIAAFNSAYAATESIWQKVNTNGMAPDSAQSVALRLVVAAPPGPLPNGAVANVLFDNVLVLKQ